MTWREIRTGLFTAIAVPPKVEVVSVVKEPKPAETVVKEPTQKTETEPKK